MLINATIMQTLREAGHAKGTIHVDCDNMRTIRLPGAPNMTEMTATVDALTAAGIAVGGYGTNLNSPHDDFIGGTIMLLLDDSAELPTDTRSALRA